MEDIEFIQNAIDTGLYLWNGAKSFYQDNQLLSQMIILAGTSIAAFFAGRKTERKIDCIKKYTKSLTKDRESRKKFEKNMQGIGNEISQKVVENILKTMSDQGIQFTINPANSNEQDVVYLPEQDYECVEVIKSQINRTCGETCEIN